MKPPVHDASEAAQKRAVPRGGFNLRAERRLARFGLWPLGAALLVLPWLFAGSSYFQFQSELIAVYVVATAGLNVAIGFSGQFQMAQPALMALSAYTCAVLAADFGWPWILAAGAGIGVSLLFASAVAVVALFTRSHYLLVATFAMQIIGIELIREFGAWTGGVNGRGAITSLSFGPWSLSGSTPGYTSFAWGVALVALVVAWRIKKSWAGLEMRASQTGDKVLPIAAVSDGLVRFEAIIISAVFAGVAGVLIGPVVAFLVPESFALPTVLLFLLMVIVGGAGSVGGVAVGTVLVVVASQAAQSSGLVQWWPLLFGVLMMAVLAVAPGGLAEMAERVKAWPNVRRGARKADG